MEDEKEIKPEGEEIEDPKPVDEDETGEPTDEDLTKVEDDQPAL